MPRRKGWKWSETKRKEWRERLRADGRRKAETERGKQWTKVDDGDGTVMDRERRGTDCDDDVTLSPPNVVAGSPPNVVAGSPSNVVAGIPSNLVAHDKGKQINGKDKQIHARTCKQANICQFKQAIIELNSLIANISSNVQTDFDTVFLDTFPQVYADHQSIVIEESCEKDSMISCPQNTMLQQLAQHDENVSTQYHFNNYSCSEPCLDNDIVSYQAARLPEPFWNATDLVFGSFHQNDVRFSEHSRGYQCTCNALCMLSYALGHSVDNSSMIDKVLWEGDSLYQTVISKLKTDGKFINQLLSLEEIPDDFEVDIGKFALEKFQVESGVLLDTEDHGLPTLHSTLQSAFSSVSCGLLTVGAICSAVFKQNGLYVFFDSHSHGQNGLSSSDGASCLITFSNLDDLVTYIYAFYDSMKLETDTNLQFDFLPVHIKKCQEGQTYEDQMTSRMEGYFKDQRFRQALKTQRNGSCRLNSESKKESLLKKRKQRNRTEYYRTFKQLARKNSAYKRKEMESKQRARKDPVFKDTEIRCQKKSKQHARKNPAFKRKEMESKQQARKDPVFKDTEVRYQKESKQHARKNPAFKRKEMESKQQARKNPVFKDTEIRYQKESKQRARKDPVFKDTEIRYQKESKQHARKDPVFKDTEVRYQKESKQHARKNPAFKRKEMESKQQARKDSAFRMKEVAYQKKSKQSARQNPAFLEREKVYQNVSKQNARKNPIVLECERIKKQQIRQEKRKCNDISTMNVSCKRFKHDTETLPHKTHQKAFKTIEETIKQFHLDISIGPIYICTCCHQTWFRKSVSMLKNTHIPEESKRLYCTDYMSVNNEEWVCHTCLSALRERKCPKLSVGNGFKWPNKPVELNLHQLEERLIALRIPFMQIRELPHGGQYSLKGNVINVPVDIQPTINCLPRPMDENFTVAIQLKKKLSYKTVDFKENVRPLRVLTALHWLMNNSKLYKNSGIVIDDDWFQEVTESAEETVREFLGVSREQTNDKHSMDNEKQEQITSKKDTNAPADYDSDHYSEIDANDHVGNIDTLVDDADIDNKCDKVYTFAPGEGQHPLSLYNDKDAEYLCFPSIFCGQTPPSKEERIVPVHYSDIVKWELRSVDRRAAQSVPNIFFKHKKLQMKQISDKVNLAVRRCKKRGQKITAAEARDSNYLDKLVNLDEGYYIFRQLRNSPAYLEMRKKDIFAMIRQLSLPTWFMSLSAADTRWTDLLKMLAKLNDGIEYSETELERLTWQEKTKLVQKDPVTFNENILLAWKANLDIQIALEPYGCASYIVGYISKSQRGMSAQLDAAAKEARRGNLDLKKQVRHIGNVFSNCVEVSAQEAVYLDLQIPLTKCTRDIVFINTSIPEERIFLLKPKAALDELPAESTDVESENVIQRYSKRPRQLGKLCLADYVSKVDITYPKGNKFSEKVDDTNDDDSFVNTSGDESDDIFDDNIQSSDLLFEAKNGTKYKKRKVPRIIRYVKYNRKRDPENYFREQLMLFVPWRNEQKDLIGSFGTYEARYNSVQTSLVSKRNEYEHHAEELEIARQMMENEERDYDQIAPNAEQENRETEEEGPAESEKFVCFNPSRVVEQRHYDIGIELQSTCSVPPVETSGILLPDDEYLQLLRSLNLRQREFFNHIVHWIKSKDEPVYAFLTGGTGVGKSVVIRALYQSLYRLWNLKDGENPDDKRILLCAYMGFAAFNISGQTISSAFHKKMYQKGTNHLSADELNTFRIKYRHLKLVIIDEISMVGNMTLNFINIRLQQLMGTKEVFGGLSVIAVGDLYQLKPVGDYLISLDLKVGASSLGQNLWKELFKMYELVDIMRQKDDLAFAQLLNRLRLNEMTEEDKQKLQARVVDYETGDYPKDALHLFAENSYVDQHNDTILSQLPGEKFTIPCHDIVVSSNIPAKRQQSLIDGLPNDYGKTGQLKKSLTVVV